MVLFANRVEAGRTLADRLEHLRGSPVVVLALPRGGVPVGAEVAAALDAPLDVIVVRKLGVPFQPELGMGAVGEDGVLVVDREIVRLASVTDQELAAVEERERVELARRVQRFRGDRARVPLDGRVALLVDDGLATGSTARAACQVARAHGAARVVLAVPVAPTDWIERMGDAADEYVCVATPDSFAAIGQFYADFRQTSDAEVVACLERGRRPDLAATVGAASPSGGPRDEEVIVRAGSARLGGHLTLPERPIGVVVFAHGSGSSRHSPRNRYVASLLHDAALGTLLFDLLTPDEANDRANVFDIELLASRLAAATAWLRAQPEAAALPVGYFGASTGAAAALSAAAAPDADIAAVVSRGGRPDMAGGRLADVRAPTLLIVGGRDDAVIGLNRDAQRRLRSTNRLVIVPGATHLFEEPGTLELAATAARDWFVEHLGPA